jgi:hypothetical protein
VPGRYITERTRDRQSLDGSGSSSVCPKPPPSDDGAGKAFSQGWRCFRNGERLAGLFCAAPQLRPAVPNSHYRVDSRSNKCNVITAKLTGYEFWDDDEAKKFVVRYIAVTPLDQQKILTIGKSYIQRKL